MQEQRGLCGLPGCRFEAGLWGEGEGSHQKVIAMIRPEMMRLGPGGGGGKAERRGPILDVAGRWGTGVADGAGGRVREEEA